MQKSLEVRLATLFEKLNDAESDLMISVLESLAAGESAAGPAKLKKTGNPLVDDAIPMALDMTESGPPHPLGDRALAAHRLL